MAQGDSLGERLVALRVQAGLSQEQLADAANVSAKTISDIERGVTLNPRAKTIYPIADALRLDAPARQGLLGRAAERGAGHTGGPPAEQAAGAFVAATLGEAVTYLRTRLGLAAAELGRRSGLSARTVADIEAGRRTRVHPASAASLADVFGLVGEARQRFMRLASGTVVPDAMRLGAVEPANLFGRRQELAALLALLADHRLVALTGPGGVGKTMLAEAALANLKRPCVSLYLAAVHGGEDLARAVALVARFDEDSGEEWVGQLGKLLPPGAVLLLDNLEHLRQAPAAIEAILATRPDIAILATSRTTVGLADEFDLEVGPLRLPAACRVFAAAADRAGRPVQAQTAATVIEEICARLDRLPLAITLAAAWSRLMTPQEILARLDRPTEILRTPGARLGQAGPSPGDRHVAIASTVRWSLALVSESARTLFSGLAAYPAPWPLDLVEAVHPAADVLDTIHELVQARLVSMATDEVGGTSYTMLQTVRDVGRAELTADPGLAGQVLERHAAHLLTQVRAVGPMLLTTARTSALTIGDQLALHVQGALLYLIDADDRRAVSLVAAWWRYWKERGRFRSGVTLITEALRVLPASEDTGTREAAEAFYGAAALAYLGGENERAAAYAGDALARYRRLGDAPGIGELMSLIGMMELHSGHPDAALDWYRRGLGEVNDNDAPRAYATLLANSAPVYAALGDLRAARAAAEDAAARYQVLGEQAGLAANLGNLAEWAARAGDRDRARELLAESRDLQVALGDSANLIQTILGLVSWLWTKATPRRHRKSSVRHGGKSGSPTTPGARPWPMPWRRRSLS